MARTKKKGCVFKPVVTDKGKKRRSRFYWAEYYDEHGIKKRQALTLRFAAMRTQNPHESLSDHTPQA